MRSAKARPGASGMPRFVAPPEADDLAGPDEAVASSTFAGFIRLPLPR